MIYGMPAPRCFHMGANIFGAGEVRVRRGTLSSDNGEMVADGPQLTPPASVARRFLIA
jgi:hypothetical protein